MHSKIKFLYLSTNSYYFNCLLKFAFLNFFIHMIAQLPNSQFPILNILS